MKRAQPGLKPLTTDEMRERYRELGQTVSTVAAAAYVRNGIGKAKVREILFEGGEL